MLPFLLSLTLACRSGDSDDGKRPQGTWLPTAAELGGKAFPDEVRKMIRLVVEGDRSTVTVEAQPDHGTVKINSAAEPKEMEITGTDGPNQGKTSPAIYELDDDTLRICYDLSGQTRPREFKTKAGTQLFLVTYSRQAPE